MKTKTGFILIGLMVLFFVTCRKDKDDPSGGNKMELGVNLIDTLSYFFTGIQTEVISLGGNEIIQHGHCWNTESNPTINENHTLLGKLSSEIDFLSIVDTLLPNTIYYIRPYIQTAYAVAYGEEEQIKTLKTGKPVVLTNPVSDITLTSALCGGIVTSDSGLVVTARGVCWDTTAGFRIDSCLGFTVDSLGLGSFSSEVTGLHEGTNYHIAAYATNEKGTGLWRNNNLFNRSHHSSNSKYIQYNQHYNILCRRWRKCYIRWKRNNDNKRCMLGYPFITDI